MSNSNIYIDFVEGNLDNTSERNFAERFASDDEFRNNFKGFLGISKSISSNIKSFGPSAAETNDIFSKLGYSAVPVAEETVSHLPFYQNQMFRISVASLFSAILGAIITLLIINPHRNSAVNEIGYQKETVKSYSANEQISAKNILMNPGAEKYNKNLNKYIKRNLAQHKKTEELKTIQNENSEIVPQAEILLSKTEKNTNKILNIEKTNTGLAQIESKTFPDGIAELTNLSPFKIEIRKSESWNLPKENIYPGEIPVFANMGISAFYEIDEDFSIGVDFRKENFYLIYLGNEGNIRYRYMQQPNFNTLGFAGRYRMKEFLPENLKPVLQLSAGANESGFVSGFMIGTEYEAYSNLSFILGFEYRGMIYSRQNEMFFSSKFGINYGLIIKL